MNQVIHGDCLEVMPTIPDKSIDMILCDLPYGTTACKWDTVIPFEPLWKEYKRLIKDNGAIVLTASQPFTSVLICSNLEMFKCEWIWEKNRGSNFANLKTSPFKEHESVLVFAKKIEVFNPQKQKRSESGRSRANYSFQDNGGGEAIGVIIGTGERRNIERDMRHPGSIQKFNTEVGLHPTQKPVALFEYLIKTYTNEGEVVLDNCAGSGTTAIACLNTNRNYILIEKEKEYIDIINKRIAEHEQQLALC